MRGALRNKERWKGRRAPTQDPSTKSSAISQYYALKGAQVWVAEKASRHYFNQSRLQHRYMTDMSMRAEVRGALKDELGPSTPTPSLPTIPSLLKVPSSVLARALLVVSPVAWGAPKHGRSPRPRACARRAHTRTVRVSTTRCVPAFALPRRGQEQPVQLDRDLPVRAAGLCLHHGADARPRSAGRGPSSLRVFPLFAFTSHAQGSSGAVATVPFVWRSHAKEPHHSGWACA